MKLDKRNYGFCCLGVKANAEDAFREDRDFDGINPAGEYLPDESEDAQAFFALLNDTAELSFKQVAIIINYMNEQPDYVCEAVTWISEMDHKTRDNWIYALKHDSYKQCKSALAKPLGDD